MRHRNFLLHNIKFIQNCRGIRSIYTNEWKIKYTHVRTTAKIKPLWKIAKHKWRKAWEIGYILMHNWNLFWFHSWDFQVSFIGLPSSNLFFTKILFVFRFCAESLNSCFYSQNAVIRWLRPWTRSVFWHFFLQFFPDIRFIKNRLSRSKIMPF